MKYLRIILPILLGCGASAASAVPPPAPADQSAYPPAYQSAFAGYKPFDDAKPRDWKQINADIAKLSGHAGMHGHDHAAMAAPARATASTPAPAAAPKEQAANPAPHAAHKHH